MNIGTSLEDAWGPDFLKYSKPKQQQQQNPIQKTLGTTTVESNNQSIETSVGSLDSPTLFSLNTMNLDSSEHSHNMQSVNIKNQDILKKIYEYELYLEQIDNEKKYVQSQLDIFRKQQVLNENGQMPSPIATNANYIQSNIQTPTVINQRNVQTPTIINQRNALNSNQTLWEQFSNLLENQLFINMLFYAFLIYFGITISQRRNN